MQHRYQQITATTYCTVHVCVVEATLPGSGHVIASLLQGQVHPLRINKPDNTTAAMITLIVINTPKRMKEWFALNYTENRHFNATPIRKNC
jgi:hypothetical protein